VTKCKGIKIQTYVKNRMVVEEVIATMTNKPNIYNAKWQVYKQNFQWVLTCNLSRKHVLLSTVFLSFYTNSSYVTFFQLSYSYYFSSENTLKISLFLYLYINIFYVLCTSRMNISYWMRCTVFQRKKNLKTKYTDLASLKPLSSRCSKRKKWKKY